MYQTIRPSADRRIRSALCTIVLFGSLTTAIFLAPETVTAQPATTSGPATDAKPVIQVAAPVQDFGTATEGTKLRHAFKITNVGNAPLGIERVAPSCGCMTAGTYPNQLGPGESGEIPVTLDTLGLFGPFLKTVNIFSNDPATPVLTLTLRGESKRQIEISPTSAGFGRISDDQTHEQIVTLTNRSDQPLVASIGDLKKAGNFEFDLVETISGYEFKLFVVLRPPPADGTYKGSVTINTNIAAQKAVEVTAMAIVLPRMESAPPVLYLSEVSPTNPISTKPSVKAVEFVNHGAKLVRIVEATVDDPMLRVSTKEVEPGRLYRVLLNLPAGYKPPNEGRTITLKTDSAERPTFPVPIRLVGAVTARTETGATTKPGSARAEAPKKPVMELVGKPAPQFSLTAISGMPVGSAEFKHYPATVLNFVAPNCPFCKRQIPTVETVRAEYQNRGIRFVNMGESLHGKVYSPQEALETIDQFGSHLELAMDEPGNKVGALFKVSSFPVLVLVGKDGTVIDAYAGARADLPEKLKARLDELLKAEASGAPANAKTGS